MVCLSGAATGRRGGDDLDARARAGTRVKPNARAIVGVFAFASMANGGVTFAAARAAEQALLLCGGGLGAMREYKNRTSHFSCTSRCGVSLRRALRRHVCGRDDAAQGSAAPRLVNIATMTSLSVLIGV